MRYLMLVRHSQPDIVSYVPGSHWQLSAEGRARCRLLAEQLSAYQPATIAASMEPKAAETAALLSAHLHIPYQTAEGLHEHERGNTPYLGQEKWEQIISTFFAQPDKLVFGSETATQALERFAGAVQKVVQEHAEGNIVIVAHATVITLLVAQYVYIPSFLFWRSLDTPAFVVLSLPSYRLLNTVVRIEMPSR
jgi:broad specificity phosphatase PhoE